MLSNGLCFSFDRNSGSGSPALKSTIASQESTLSQDGTTRIENESDRVSRSLFISWLQTTDCKIFFTCSRWLVLKPVTRTVKGLVRFAMLITVEASQDSQHSTKSCKIWCRKLRNFSSTAIFVSEGRERSGLFGKIL